MENFRRSPQKLIGWTQLLSTSTPFRLVLIGVKCREEGGRFDQFKYFENQKSYVNSRCQILISEWKVFCLFQKIFVPEKVRKWSAWWKQITSPAPTPRVTPLGYSGVIRVKIIVLKRWVFFENIWNFSKWKSLIIDEKCCMLWKTMLRETKNAEGKCRREKLQ